MTDPMIVGWSHTRFGKSDAPDTCALMAEAIPTALDHAGISAADVDGIFTGVFNNGFSAQDFQGALAGMAVPDLAQAPATRYENACATGSAALYGAMDFIAAGRGRIALVIGAEKMTATPTSEVGDILLGASFCAEEAGIDAGFAGPLWPDRGRVFPTLWRPIARTGHDCGQESRKRHVEPLCAYAKGP